MRKLTLSGREEQSSTRHARAAAMWPDPLRARGGPTSSRILVVEQNPAFGRELARLLSSHGYQSDCVTSSVAALTLARDDRYAIVVADLQTPGIDGVAFVDRLAPANPKTRFVLLTDGGDLDLVAGCANASAIVSLFHAPWDENDLVETIRQTLAIDSEPIAARHSLAACTALIVEDNEADENLVREYLADAGMYYVERAQRLSDAIEMLEHRPVDVVLTDLALPDAAGLDCVRRLTRHTPRSALVVLSGSTDEDLALQAVRIGAQDFLMKEHLSGPVLQRSIRYARERKRAEIGLARLAHNDLLTGVANRISFRDHVERSISRSKRHRTQFAVMYVDLDGFKSVNDVHGHEAGDGMLMEVARRLVAAVRPSDVVARLGGDEFAVLLEDIHGVHSAVAVAERILANLAPPLELSTANVTIAASIGIAVFPDAADDYRSLVAAADEAMYTAKRLGGRTYQIHRPSNVT